MSRPYSPSENAKKARGRRQFALERLELRSPTQPRIPASGPISAAVKARNDVDDALVAEFMARRETEK